MSQPYARVLDLLLSARRGGVDLDLRRTQDAIRAIAPQRPRCVIQVAGTNGKGSTSCFVEAVCRKAGLRTGVFSSPHLLTVRERFRLDGQQLSEEEFLVTYERVAAHATGLTFFEILTVMAADVFGRSNVDVAIYEVGLGGRLDSTTALDVDVAVVTGIGLDHCEFLGDSLESIADEKAGIFREGRPAVIGPSAPEYIRVLLRDRALECGATPICVGPEHSAEVPRELAMMGAHQRDNAATAVATLACLAPIGIELSSRSLADGLATAQLAGRLEEIDPGLWIDAAHNPQAARALADSAEFLCPAVLVIGLSAGKDIRGFLKPWCNRPVVALIATAADNDRSYPPQEIAQVARSLGIGEVRCVSSVLKALRLAQSMAQDRPVLVTGSLYVLGEALSELGKGRPDPVRLSDPSSSLSPCSVHRW